MRGVVSCIVCWERAGGAGRQPRVRPLDSLSPRGVSWKRLAGVSLCVCFFLPSKSWLGYVHKAAGLLVVFVGVRRLFLPTLGDLFFCVGVVCVVLLVQRLFVFFTEPSGLALPRLG